jgi:NADH-quinone oxidoreductase subunit N
MLPTLEPRWLLAAASDQTRLPTFIPTIDIESVLDSSLLFLPELVLCGGIVLLLLLRLLPQRRRKKQATGSKDQVPLGWVALLLLAIALGFSVLQWLAQYTTTTPSSSATSRSFHQANVGLSSAGIQMENPSPSQPFPGRAFFGSRSRGEGLLAYDAFTVYLRIFLYLFTFLVIWLTLTTGIPDQEDSADFYTLLLGATLGMALMAMSNHLLMIFIAVEMASLPSYALAGFLKGKRISSEAALKYVVYGGGSAGIMLYGISLLAGRFGTGYLPELAAAYIQAIKPAGATGLVFDPVVILGTLFLMIGVAFKLAAVPFHFWCPDVFEGASAEVAGFLSVASKGAALALLTRIVFVLGGLDRLMFSTSPMDDADWMALIRYLVPTLAFFAALTATFGNLAAYLQTNLKRLLAWSTIAHAGYMLMGLAVLQRSGVEAVLFYLIAYLIMNLGAFACVAYLRNLTGSEDLESLRGIIRRAPALVIILGLFLLSLLGMPPLIGFTAKFQIFAVLFNVGRDYQEVGEPTLAYTLYALLVIGGLNTVLSAVYYLKVMRIMILERRAEDLEGVAPQRLREPIAGLIFSGLLAFALVLLGVLWDPLAQTSRDGAIRFLSKPGPPQMAQAAPGAPGLVPKGPKGPAAQKGPKGPAAQKGKR